jgi:predicted ATP-dependent endonuclease of OLD family
MIKNIKIIDGVLKKLFPNITQIDFNDSINIIWGKNGIGKSTLLNCISDYVFVDNDGGWSQNDIYFTFHCDESYKYDTTKDWFDNINNTYQFNRFSKLKIDWDGVSCFLMDHSQFTDKHLMAGYEMSTGTFAGLKHNFSFMKLLQKSYSSGQIILELNKYLLNLLDEEIPNLKDMNDDYKWKKYFDQFSFDGKPTILLDEMDSQLDYENQYWYHFELLPKLAERFQIICISHSIFSLKHNNTVNLIDLDNSSNKVKELIK